MVAYNHTVDNLWDRIGNQVDLYHSGDFICTKCGKDIGKQSKYVQQHFQNVHGYNFSNEHTDSNDDNGGILHSIKSIFI